ncbi:MAG: hypothetical protein GXO95_01440 [Nitrospirae bacterium]|nr:hypothetical protein [Nitrospirota bacterium]
MKHKFTAIITAIIQKEDAMFVALCPELDIASQGDTIEEAVTLFFEHASPEEIKGNHCNCSSS